MDENMSKNVLEEIQDVKRLLILHLLKSGAGPNEIRALLKLSGASYKELIPIKKVKKYSSKSLKDTT